MKILIVDDEALARSRLRRMLEELGNVEVIGEADNGVDALTLICQQHPDIALLDIRMPAMGGLELARHLTALDHPPAVIFTTAFDNHALAAFETQAIGYLLKPVRKELLKSALDAARRLNRAQLSGLEKTHETGTARSHISACIGAHIELIAVADIYYFQAEQKYTSVHHKGGETVIEEPLKDLEEEFGERFLRIHRNALVAKHYISGMHKDENGQYTLTLNGCDQQLEVSRRMASSVKEAIKKG
ncbi:MAG: LytTR family DNA-binding domain-containing protein [Pseudomonadota bacterium]